VLENLQRRLAAQNLDDRSEEMEETYEEKRSVPAAGVAAPPTALCRFFVLGKCRYGSRCTFSHSLPTQVSDCAANETDGLSAAAALVDCPFFLRGNCKYGEYCRLRHNPALLPGAAVAVAALSAPTARSTAGTSGAATSAASAPRQDNQQDFTCGICFDDIVESGKHFGLLSGFNAVF
jgi:hypothetical protein